MAKLTKERELLKNAIQDLDTELKSLRTSKKELEGKLNRDSAQLDFVKEQEIKLRNLISLSMEKETLLLKKKQKAKDKLGELEKRIEKVRAIERELQDV